MALATALLSSCKGDYTDWATPQANAEELAESVNLSISAANKITLTESTPDSVQLLTAQVSSTSQTFTAKPLSYTVKLSKNEESEANPFVDCVMSFDGKIPTAALAGAVSELYGDYPTERTLKVQVNGIIQVGSGQTVAKTSNETTLSVTTYNYGTDFTINGTSLTTDEESYPNFTATLTLAEGEAWTIKDAQGNTLLEGEAGTAGKYNVSFDASSVTGDVTLAPTELYLTGSHYGWNTWKQLTPIYGTDDEFWTIIYLDQDEQFKFAPQAGWGNDFGMSATVNDEAGAGLSKLSGSDNCVVSNAGWYLLHVKNGATRTINVYKPKVYLIGNTVGGDWTVNDNNLFTVPETRDGQFVSPVFSTDGALRMCVSFGGYDWWKTEFIIKDGKIDYRGKGGDQEALNVTAGQKAYLSFDGNTGEVK